MFNVGDIVKRDAGSLTYSLFCPFSRVAGYWYAVECDPQGLPVDGAPVIVIAEAGLSLPHREPEPGKLTENAVRFYASEGETNSRECKGFGVDAGFYATIGCTSEDQYRDAVRALWDKIKADNISGAIVCSTISGDRVTTWIQRREE